MKLFRVGENKKRRTKKRSEQGKLYDLFSIVLFRAYSDWESSEQNQSNTTSNQKKFVISQWTKAKKKKKKEKKKNQKTSLNPGKRKDPVADGLNP